MAWYEWLGIGGILFFSMVTWLVGLGMAPDDAISYMSEIAIISGLILYLRYWLSKGDAI